MDKAEENITRPRETNLIDEFLDHLWLQDNLAINTLNAYRRDLLKLEHQLHEQGCDLLEATPDNLAQILVKNESVEKSTTRARQVSVWRRFYAYIIGSGYLTKDPCARLKTPRIGLRLPKSLSEEHVEALLLAPDVDTPLGLRDRAMLELMYATGLRVSETVSLRMDRLNLLDGIVQPIGKGDKERLVPLGEVAQEWLGRYIEKSRPALLAGAQCDALIVTRRKAGMTRQMAWTLISGYASRLGLGKVSPHTLRHAFATHLVNHGADLRAVQMLLGHSDISTTQIYTYVAHERLQRLHQQHHPRG